MRQNYNFPVKLIKWGLTSLCIVRKDGILLLKNLFIKAKSRYLVLEINFSEEFRAMKIRFGQTYWIPADKMRESRVVGAFIEVS